LRKPGSGTYSGEASPEFGRFDPFRAIGEKNLMRGAELSAEFRGLTSKGERKVKRDCLFR